VVGADKHLAAYQALAQKCAPGRVKFTGGLDSIDIPLAASDIFALPSLYDSFSNAVLEAMAYGLPVITSLDTGIADWFRQRESGGIVCERNAEALLDSIQESLRFRKTMEVNAISTASKFDHGTIIPMWLELYKETLGRK
jgi:UDP-glucose:(heptosyl)LPS alpha-1,3-glucosyltransferase